MDSIAVAKAALRAAAKARRAALSPEFRNDASRRLAGCAERLLPSKRGGVVAGFMPFGAEIDPWPLLMALSGQGMGVAIPRIDGGDISFRLFRPGDALMPGVFGIAEPLDSAEIVQPNLILVPLLAFDRAGNRLGYGKGYYDRALAGLPEALAVGVAFGMQEAETLPVALHDRPLNLVLTEAGVIDCVAHIRD